MVYSSSMAIDVHTLRLTEARRVVVKVGSAVLTGPNGLNLDVIDHLAGELAALHSAGRDVILVSSGAVAAGRRRVAEGLDEGLASPDLHDLPGRQAASAVGQGRLMHAYDEALSFRNKIIAQVLLTRDGMRLRKRFLNARNTLQRLLDWRVIPIINENDTVAVEEIFGDNDTLASMTLGLVGADLFINLTSAAGVFDKNPDGHPDAKRLAVIEDIHALNLANLCDGKTAVGSGGMQSKLLAAMRAAQLGVPTLILSGRGAFSLTRALEDPSLGTLVPPDAHAVSSKKYWLAYHDDPSGEVMVDAGAARALERGHKSLLPAGMCGVQGNFEPGALVRIRHQDGRPLGVGVSNYGSDELSRILGRRTDEIETILGHEPYSVAIHRDNLLIDAAIRDTSPHAQG